MDASEIVTTRTFPVPPEALFRAFEDPARLARWFGPAGATNEIHELDLRPGGRWRLTMTTPDGTRHPMEKRFVAVERPRRVVVAHDQEGHSFTIDMRYEPAPEGTRLTWRMRFATPGQLAPIREIVQAANEQNLDRLAAHLRERADAIPGE